VFQFQLDVTTAYITTATYVYPILPISIWTPNQRTTG